MGFFLVEVSGLSGGRGSVGTRTQVLFVLPIKDYTFIQLILN